MALETGPRFKIARHEIIQASRVCALMPKLVCELWPGPVCPAGGEAGIVTSCSCTIAVQTPNRHMCRGGAIEIRARQDVA